MPEIELRAEDVLAESEAIRDAVARVLPTKKKDEGLHLTGLEILAFIGVKMAIPIFSGLISRVVYDKYKDFQTRSRGEAALSELLEQKGEPGEAVGDEEIIEHTTARLIDEGVAEAPAREIAAQALAGIKQRLAAKLA